MIGKRKSAWETHKSSSFGVFPSKSGKGKSNRFDQERRCPFPLFRHFGQTKQQANFLSSNDPLPSASLLFRTKRNDSVFNLALLIHRSSSGISVGTINRPDSCLLRTKIRRSREGFENKGGAKNKHWACLRYLYFSIDFRLHSNKEPFSFSFSLERKG